MKERTQRKGELNERIPYDNVIPIGRIRNLITFCCVVNVRVRDTITSAPRGTLCKRLCDSLSSRAFGTPRCSMSPSYIHVFTSRHTTGVAHGTEAHEAKGASSPIAIASFAGVPRLCTKNCLKSAAVSSRPHKCECRYVRLKLRIGAKSSSIFSKRTQLSECTPGPLPLRGGLANVSFYYALAALLPRLFPPLPFVLRVGVDHFLKFI